MMSEDKTARRKHADGTFLEGPGTRLKELAFIIRVAFEFIKGFRKLHFNGPCITVFGSARFKEGHRYYQMAREVGESIAKEGFTVMTGGGPGIMEAANRGAMEAGGKSIGCNIVLPMEQHPNPYLHKWVNIKYFFVRKVLLSKYSYAFVVLPGGMGTMDEMFEALTLIQTGKMEKFPIVVMGKEYYKELLEHIELMAKRKTIDRNDMELFLVTDSVEEAVAHIKQSVDEKLHRRKPFKPLAWLGEKRII